MWFSKSMQHNGQVLNVATVKVVKLSHVIIQIHPTSPLSFVCVSFFFFSGMTSLTGAHWHKMALVRMEENIRTKQCTYRSLSCDGEHWDGLVN